VERWLEYREWSRADVNHVIVGTLVGPGSVGLRTNSNAGTRMAGCQLCHNGTVVHDSSAMIPQVSHRPLLPRQSNAASRAAMTQSTGEGAGGLRQAGDRIPGANVRTGGRVLCRPPIPRPSIT
jgi:hypothetical protein